MTNFIDTQTTAQGAGFEYMPVEPDRSSQQLPTPADMIKASTSANGDVSNISLEQSPQETQFNAAGESQVADKKLELTDEQSLVLKAKLDAGMELTDDEKKILSEIDKIIEIKEQPVYRIDGQEFQYDEMKNKALEYYQVGKDITLSPESEKIMVESYAKISNQKAANQSIDKGFKDNAQERQRVAIERARLEQVADNLFQQQQVLLDRKRKLENILVNQVSAEDVQDIDGRIDVQKLNLYTSQQNALNELPEIDKGLQKIDQNLELSKYHIDITKLNEFIFKYPQYATTEPIEAVAYKIVNNDPTVNPEDKIKVRELNEFLVNSSPNRGITLEDNYLYKLRSNSLAVKPPVHTEERKNETKTYALPKPQIMSQKVELFRRDMQRKTPLVTGTGAPVRQEQPTKASEIIAHDRRVMGRSSDNSFLREFGYN